MAKTTATTERPSQPDPSANGVRAHLVAMAGVLRCSFGALPALASSLRIRLNSNDRRIAKQTRYAHPRLPQRTRYLRIFMIVLRMVVAVTAVQFSGVSHAVADVITMVQGDHEHAHDCPNDEDGRPCPPGCPSCHCTHPMSALPLLGPPFLLDPPNLIDIACVPYEAQGPPGPEPAALYRPPRAVRG